MKSIEFKATKKSIETMLEAGAIYKMSENPQYGVDLIQWTDIESDQKKSINLNNCKFINTMDSFILNDIAFCPIK